jgi:Prolyl oligopeptidase family
MKHLFLVLVAVLVAPVVVRADSLPKSILSSPCKSPPTIDGAIGTDEWKDAKAISFDLELVGLNPAAKGTRACQLWVMNSANALYIAFRVPDETVNASMNPIDIDLAILAFCKGKQLQAGDDRKVIAPGLYADKHFVAPGKDEDDKHKDGRGAVGHEKGVYSFEWAIPLDSGDKEDLQAKPGDSVRFNLAYFDSFKADLKGTQVGGVFGADMDHADNWGTIELATKVENDGGAAFKGPAWIETLFKTFRGPAARLRLTDSALTPGVPRPIAKALVSFTYRDPHGKPTDGKATIYLPAAVQDPKTRLPLYFNAGYELDDNGAAAHVRRGYAVVSPRALETNPLIRTANPDIALLHMARALPFVDDAHVVIGGGSAGGYMTLMLAAETFPLAAAAPDVPPVNWGYNAAYFFKQKSRIALAKGDTVSKVPVLFAVGNMLADATKVYGDNYGDATWFAHSPIAHVSTITCPVSVNWSTADVLVPIDQVGAKWVKSFDAKKFPAGFTMDPEKLTDTKQGRTRLIDVLTEKDYELFELPVTKDAMKNGGPPNSGTPKSGELPISTTKQWSIAIIDEGPPEPQVGHMKYVIPWTREKFLEQAKTNKPSANQLTETKLERLMDRYAGKEWLPSPLKHLDEPESERADVLRGLRTYVSAGPENARRFAELYGKLSAERKVLEEGVVKGMGEVK